MILSALIFRPGEDYTNIHQTPDTTQYQNIGRDGTDTVRDETYYDWWPFCYIMQSVSLYNILSIPGI